MAVPAEVSGVSGRIEVSVVSLSTVVVDGTSSSGVEVASPLTEVTKVSVVAEVSQVSAWPKVVEGSLLTDDAEDLFLAEVRDDLVVSGDAVESPLAECVEDAVVIGFTGD